jgi:hypothetical protein
VRGVSQLPSRLRSHSHARCHVVESVDGRGVSAGDAREALESVAAPYRLSKGREMRVEAMEHARERCMVP